MTHHFVVTFDVASPAARHAVHQILGRYGIRTLNTVYDIHADQPTADALIEQLRPHIGTNDHLLMLAHCDNCRTATRGPSIENYPPHAWITA